MTVYTKELQHELLYEQLLEKYPDAKTVYDLPEYMHKVNNARVKGMDVDVMLLYPDIYRPIPLVADSSKIDSIALNYNTIFAWFSIPSLVVADSSKIDSITQEYNEIFAKMWLDLVTSHRKIASDKSKSGDKTIRRKSPYNFGRSKY